jgi:hypothetical protein
VGVLEAVFGGGVSVRSDGWVGATATLCLHPVKATHNAAAAKPAKNRDFMKEPPLDKIQ